MQSSRKKEDITAIFKLFAAIYPRVDMFCQVFSMTNILLFYLFIVTIMCLFADGSRA